VREIQPDYAGHLEAYFHDPPGDRFWSLSLAAFGGQKKRDEGLPSPPYPSLVNPMFEWRVDGGPRSEEARLLAGSRLASELDPPPRGLGGGVPLPSRKALAGKNSGHRWVTLRQRPARRRPWRGSCPGSGGLSAPTQAAAESKGAVSRRETGVGSGPCERGLT